MGEKMRKFLERVKAALRQKRTRIALAAIVAIVVIIALILIFRVILGPATPKDPSNLAATVVSYSQIDLSWQDNSDNEIGFKIERKTGAGGNYQQIATAGANVIKYSDTGLSGDTTYYYRVRAFNDKGDSPYASNQAGALEVSATTLSPPPPTPPNAPSNLVAVAISSSQMDLTWGDNSDNEIGFKIDRKTGAGGSYAQVAVVGINVTTYRDQGLIENTTYYYRVRAYNDVGHSSYSNEDSNTTLPPKYHVMGGTAEGSSLLVAVVSVTETDRYREGSIFDPATYSYLAPHGSMFVVVSVSTSNRGEAPLTIRRVVDFTLRDVKSRDRYGVFDYKSGDVGQPYPDNVTLSRGETVTGVILYLVPETAPLSGMEVTYLLEGTLHIWQP